MEKGIIKLGTKITNTFVRAALRVKLYIYICISIIYETVMPDIRYTEGTLPLTQ